MSGAVVGAVIGAASAASQAAAAAKATSKQRAFIAEQRATAFQTQRADLEAAGYNPLYAFQSNNSGAPTLGGTPFNPGSGIGGAVTSGLNAFKVRQEKKNLEAQEIAIKHGGYKDWALGNLAATQGATAQSQQHLNEANEKLLGVNTRLLELEIPGATTAAQIERSDFGKATRYIKRGVESVNPLSRGIGTKRGRR